MSLKYMLFFTFFLIFWCFTKENVLDDETKDILIDIGSGVCRLRCSAVAPPRDCIMQLH